MTVFYNAWARPSARKTGLLTWTWSVTDGMVGPTLIGPHTTRTERSARHRAHQAAAGCRERPVGHHVTAVHALTDTEVEAICAGLAGLHLPVRVAVDDAEVVHLWPLEPVTTAGEVTILAAFIGGTDCRISWHGAVA